MRPLAQQPLDIFDRHVPFDEVAADFRRMARAHSVRQPYALLHGVQIVHIVHFDLEAGVTQALDPDLATPARRILGDLHQRQRRFGGRPRTTGEHEGEQESGDDCGDVHVEILRAAVPKLQSAARIV